MKRNKQRKSLQTARERARWSPVRVKKLTENDRRFRSELKYLAHLQSPTFCRIIGCVNMLLMKENSRFAEYKVFFDFTEDCSLWQWINRIYFTFEERCEVKFHSVSRDLATKDSIQYVKVSTLNDSHPPQCKKWEIKGTFGCTKWPLYRSWFCVWVRSNSSCAKGSLLR